MAINSAWSFTTARICWNAGYAHPSNVWGVPSKKISWRARADSCSGSATGKGRSSRASMRRNAEVQAPIARANDRIAEAEVTLFFLSWRQPKMASARSESSHATTRMSWLSSRCRSAEPNALGASAGSRPCSIASWICDWNSSSISRLKGSPRTAFAMRDQRDMSKHPCFLFGTQGCGGGDAHRADYGWESGEECAPKERERGKGPTQRDRGGFFLKQGHQR